MAKYLDPKADVTFKKVFGEHKNLVISLLNALLPLDEGKQVEKIEYLPLRYVTLTPLNEYPGYNILCEETGGRKFIVELHMNMFNHFTRCVTFRDDVAYVRQKSLAEEYNMSHEVYSLILINEDVCPKTDQYYHYYPTVKYTIYRKPLAGLHFVFVELPKFRAKNLTETKMQVLWLRFLTEIDESTKKAATALLDNPQISEALEIVEESGLNDAERAAYEGFWDRVSIEATQKAYMDKAIAERDAAVEKLRQDKLDTARKMKAKGFSADDIADLTGLAAEEIKAL